MKLLHRVKRRIPELTYDDSQDALLEELILSAREMFISLRYPVTPPRVDGSGIPIINSRWDGWIVSAVAEMYGKIGAEGQNGHTENGISRSWESADLSKALCSRVVPVVGVASRANA